MSQNSASSNSQPKACALVLTGGGARAAYQVGVLKAIGELYPRNHASPFSVLCGTSAGAINATALAVYASCFRLGIKKLEYIWRNFHCQHVFRTDVWCIAKQLALMVGSGFKANYARQHSFALLDNQPLSELLNSYLNYKRIDQNIGSNYLQALAVTSSNYHDGNSISFYQAAHQQQDWQRERRLGKKTQIHTSHLLASASIPLIFPPTLVGQDYYGDGSIHQLCPLSPAIHLGADKILTIQLEQKRPGRESLGPLIPNASTIAGHLLNSIFSDTLNSDLERAERINRTIAKLGSQQREALGLRPLDIFSIKPNIDFDSLSHSYYLQLPRSIRLLLRGLGIKQDEPSSITSFLMFEQGYTRRLIELGYQDGKSRSQEIRAFLS